MLRVCTCNPEEHKTNLDVHLQASLEHVVVDDDVKLKVVAGGLGKMAGLMCKYHPGDLISVHPCMPDKDYSFATRSQSVFATVSGQTITIHVLEYTPKMSKKDAKVRSGFWCSNKICPTGELGHVPSSCL